MRIPCFKRNIIASITISVSCTVLFLVGYFFSVRTDEIWDVVWNGYDTLPTLFNVLALFVLSLSYNGKFSFVKTVSTNTLGIYFIHPIFINFLRPMVMLYPIACTYVGTFFLASIVVILSLVSTLVIKKIPLVRRLLIV